MARRKNPGRASSVKSSDDVSSEESEVADDSGRTKQWLSDVTNVLERPTIALALFALGVFFIVLASKQVKKCFDLMEMLGIAVRPRDGILNNFMAAFVFFFVWLDIIIVTKFKRWMMEIACRIWRYAMKVKASMKDVENKERQKSRNKKRRP